MTGGALESQLTRLLASIVYEATPRDPLVLTGVVLAMALIGLAATWIPAQRALSIDPAMLLRGSEVPHHDRTQKRRNGT